MNHSSETGVALITALVITALAVVIAAGMASAQQIDVRRTGNVLDGDQAYLYALGIESWAQGVLAEDRRNNQTDTLQDVWAMVLPPINVPGGKVAGGILDQQGLFNLNNLVQNGQKSEADVKIFQRLLINLKLDPDLVWPLVDWIDPDVELSFPNGAEDAEYLKRAPPYRTANAPLASVSELMLVNGYGAKMYAELLPYVCALPAVTRINVNTAPAQVLAALADGIALSEAESVIKTREQQPFASVQEFAAHPALAGRAVPQDKLSVQSSYFLASGAATAGRAQVQLYSLLFRNDAGVVSTLARAQGAY
jgi:general secretion pathway protein K